MNILFKRSISSNTVIKRSDNQLYSEIDGEVVMLNINNSEYYYLDRIGSYIWHILSDPCTYKDLISKLLDSYEVTREECQLDTKLFIEELIDKGVISIVNDYNSENI